MTELTNQSSLGIPPPDYLAPTTEKPLDTYESKVNGEPVSADKRNTMLIRLAEINPNIKDLINRLVK